LKNTGIVFVYGTLKVGGAFSYYFDAFRLKSENACIKGKLYDLGSFPALILPGNDIIFGEIHKYSNFDKVIKWMDEIEGYSEWLKSGNLYERKTVKATTDNGKIVNAIVYTLSDENLVKLAKKGHFSEVESGKWD